MLCPSEWPVQGSLGNGLAEFLGTQTSLPREPVATSPSPSCCPQGAVIPILPACSPDPDSSLGDGKGSFPARGPDAMLYAFLFFQHVVKFITPSNDFLTVLGKEKERERKKKKKNRAHEEK